MSHNLFLEQTMKSDVNDYVSYNILMGKMQNWSSKFFQNFISTFVLWLIFQFYKYFFKFF